MVPPRVGLAIAFVPACGARSDLGVGGAFGDAPAATTGVSTSVGSVTAGSTNTHSSNTAVSVSSAMSSSSTGCHPTSCLTLAFDCGTADDGCGGTLDCGTCMPPQWCGGSGSPNVCGWHLCTPKTCQQLGLDCGAAPDGCGGELSCGTCPVGKTCGGGGMPNVCCLDGGTQCANAADCCTHNCAGGVCSTFTAPM